MLHKPLVPTARISGDCNKTWRGGETKKLRCIRHLQKALTSPCFRKQGSTPAKFILVYQKVFVPKKFCQRNSCRFFAHDQGTFCLVFAFYFTSCYNLDVLPQSGMPQQNGLNVQSW